MPLHSTTLDYRDFTDEEKRTIEQAATDMIQYLPEGDAVSGWPDPPEEWVTFMEDLIPTALDYIRSDLYDTPPASRAVQALVAWIGSLAEALADSSLDLHGTGIYFHWHENGLDGVPYLDEWHDGLRERGLHHDLDEWASPVPLGP